MLAAAFVVSVLAGSEAADTAARGLRGLILFDREFRSKLPGWLRDHGFGKCSCGGWRYGIRIGPVLYSSMTHMMDSSSAQSQSSHVHSLART